MKIIKGNLYKSKTGLIVMAEAQQKEDCFSGQVIIGDDQEQVGNYEKIWAISYFKPYSAEIIIKEVIDFSKVQFVEMNDGSVVLTDGLSGGEGFTAVDIKKVSHKYYEKSDVKKVVTPNFT
jgi:hypothetical protein